MALRSGNTVYWNLKQESLDGTLWRTCFERRYGPVVRQATLRTNKKLRQSFSLYRLLKPLGQVEVCCTLFKTSALKMGVGGQHHAPAALPPEKTRYPLYRRLGGPQARSRQVRKISPPSGFDPRTV